MRLARPDSETSSKSLSRPRRFAAKMSSPFQGEGAKRLRGYHIPLT